MFNQAMLLPKLPKYLARNASTNFLHPSIGSSPWYDAVEEEDGPGAKKGEV
jgi:hypothetical protein